MHGRHRDRIWLHGPGPFPAPVMLPFGPPGFGPGRRRRRGDVRAAVLLLLEQQPRNGYQLMQELEERSGGLWRPSPGSVYPALQLLADEGLIRSESRDGGNVYELTDAGRAHVEEHRERLGTPWQPETELPEGVRELREAVHELMQATHQVMHGGGEAERAAAVKLLAETRRGLYRILAGDER